MLLVLTGALAWAQGLGLILLIMVASRFLVRPYLGGIAELRRTIEQIADTSRADSRRIPTLSANAGTARASTVDVSNAAASYQALGGGSRWARLEGAEPVTQGLARAVTRLIRQSDEQSSQLAGRLAEVELVLAALPDPLIMLDDRRTVLRTNAAAEGLFGPGERFQARDLALLIRSPGVLAAADAVLGGASAQTVEFSLLQPVEREMSARVEPLGAHAIGHARALIVLYDHTRAKRTEQMRADFVANASHELKTPLSTLIGFIETLRGPAQGDPEAQERFLGIMHEQAARMARLVQDLLSLSRIELNEHLPPTRPVAIADLLLRVADSFEIKAAGRDMRIEKTVGGDLPEVAGDEDELAQVVQNLLDNAINYGRSGTAVTVSAMPSARLAGGVAIAVRDQGDGIERVHLPRLTERFYRVDTARSRALGGTGLGLAIVKHIVNRHRGILLIESEPGQGSVFTVHLRPFQAAAAAASTITERSARARRTA